MNESWLQIICLFFANAALIMWFRAESRSDYRHMDAKIEANLQGMRQEMKEFREIVQAEMKDFHGRLCAIEERNKGK
jgi:hypothetical protein